MVGRLIFTNLKKSIRYTLTHVFPEVAAFLVFITTAIPLPVSSLLLLLVDLGSELGPALSFAFEPAEGDLMLVPPRKVLCVEKSKILVGTELKTAISPNQINRQLPLWRRITLKLRATFTSEETGEALIDYDLLFWVLLQGGVIEALGCFGAYFIVLALKHVPFDMLYTSAKAYWKIDAPSLTLTNGNIV